MEHGRPASKIDKDCKIYFILIYTKREEYTGEMLRGTDETHGIFLSPRDTNKVNIRNKFREEPALTYSIWWQ